MSVAFTQEGRSNPNTQSVQALLDENSQLIQAIVDYQNKGKAYECTRYQQLLHRNLVYLATLADSSQTNQSSQGSVQNPQGTKPTSSVSPPVHNQGPPAPPPVQGSMMPEPSNIPTNDPMTSSQNYPSMSNQGNSNYGNMPATPSPPQLQPPPQLQHPPAVSGSSVGMGYPTPSNQQVRSQGPAGMVGGMQNMSQQSQMARHTSQMPQHMMPQVQQNQQYMLQQQQRQMQYRQTQPQQATPQQQPPMVGPPANTYNQQQTSNMIPGYQPQQQRYNPYRPQPPPQQTLSHMPYPQQQNQMVMGQAPMGAPRAAQMPMDSPAEWGVE